MLTFLLFSESATVLNCAEELFSLIAPDKAVKKFEIASGTEDSEQKRLAEFDRVFTEVNAELQESDPVHNRFIGIIDCRFARSAEDLHALTRISGMLILAFPEIQWLPLYKSADIMGDGAAADAMTLKKAVDLCRGDYSPLFDGDGLRSMLLYRVHHSEKEKLSAVPRKDVAIAIDEESHFAFINAYTAYRFGYRCFPVTTAQCAEALLRETRDNIPCALPEAEVNSVMVFEDICLNFPDRNNEYAKNIAFGDVRDRKFKLIPDADLRVITTAALPVEKVAKLDGKDVSIDTFFKRHYGDGGGYRSVKCHSLSPWKRILCALGELRELWKRRYFNSSGGNWWGYGLLNFTEMVTYIVLLSWTFLGQHYYWLLAVLIFIFLRFSTRDYVLRHLLHASVRYGFGGKFFFKRQQWPFMPKRYIHHHPLWQNTAEGGPRAGVHYWEVAHKPLAGIFGLRNKCDLPNGSHCPGVYNSSQIITIYRNAMRTGRIFESAADAAGNADGGNGHAAEGAALEIAMRLIRRAESMKGKTIDAEGAIHAAVLADVALELLNCQTPAVSMEALLWKHYFELLAECEFVGVRANLDMADRYIDIHNAMGRICRTRSAMVRDVVFLSGMAEIIEKLSKLLRDNGKLEEAAYFTTHSRRLHRKLLSPPIGALMAYPEWVLRNKLNFMISFGCFFLLFVLFLMRVSPSGSESFFPSLFIACKVMISRMWNDPPAGSPEHAKFIVMLARQVAVLHLGFVAAHFLMFMNRK